MITTAPNDNKVPDQEPAAPPASRESAAGCVARAAGLTLSFGPRRVLNAVDFDLKARELVYLQGENGSGKTTLLNVMGGFQSADAGRVVYYLHGFQASSTWKPERLARLGLGRLWQDIRLFGSMSVLDNVRTASPGAVRAGAVGGALRWFTSHKRRAIEDDLAREHLNLVGLGNRERSSCDMLSIGQMKRVALARLLQADAKILLLDEPLAGLDIEAAETLANLLRRLVNDLGVTILLTSHFKEPLVDLVDRTWLLADGHLN